MVIKVNKIQKLNKDVNLFRVANVAVRGKIMINYKLQLVSVNFSVNRFLDKVITLQARWDYYSLLGTILFRSSVLEVSRVLVGD